MTFAWPYLLWLLLAPLALFVWELARRRGADANSHPKILQAEAGARRLVLVNRASRTSRARPWFCIGVAFSIVALARPQWGRLEEPVFDQAREILIAIDLSRSMLTPDVKPSRLDRAKLLTQSLLEKLSGERVGLVVFSGTAFLQSPLSADYEIMREFLPALNPDFLPEGGTNYRALIDTSLSAFGSTAAADRFLIILSDGEATEDNWRDRVDALKKKGIRVIGLGVGTAAGAMIPDGSGGLVKDQRGAVVLSKLEPATLRELADATNGVYQDASNWIDLPALINATVEAGRKGQFMEKNTVRLVERFQWPLAFAIWCLLVSFYYEFPVRPKPREVKLVAGDRDPSASAGEPGKGVATSVSKPAPSALPVVTALMFLVAGFSLSGSARAAEPAGAPAPLLARIVGRLSAADQRTGRDWAELAQETATWGSHLQSAQQPVPEGPVRDALAAVDLGSHLDPKTADWTKIRADLEALLEKSENKKQEQKNQQDQQRQQNKNEQNQNQQNQNQPKQDQQQKQEQQQKNPSQQNESSQQKEPDEQKANSEDQPNKENESAFGNMKDRAQPPPPPPENSQKVGGVPAKQGDQPPTDPSLALPLQKLDQLRNQDSPAELFQLMEGEKKSTAKKPAKDW